MANMETSRRSFCLLLGATGLLSLAPGRSRAAAVNDAAPGADAVPYPGIVGELRTYVTKYVDTFSDVGRKYDLGYTEMVAANPGIDPWVPGKGVKLVLPSWHILPDAPRKGIVINLADQRVYYFRGAGIVETAPIGIGREGWNTPTGTTRIIRKQKDPTWYVPKSIRKQEPDLPAFIGPGPDDPLGDRAMYLGWSGYLMHGTNKPYGVGRRVSHGCIRMFPEDIHRFFEQVPIGTQVRVVNQTVKVANFAGRVWLEVPPNLEQVIEIGNSRPIKPAKPPEFEAKIIAAAGDQQSKIDWPTAYRAARERLGYPIAITPGGADHQQIVPLLAEERADAPESGHPAR